MPPKRKRKDEIEPTSEPDAVPQRRPTASNLLPEVMQNIETVKIKRDITRKKITAEYDAYIDESKKRIEGHYATEAKKRSLEAKALLTRYIEALEKQASIERSIERIVLNTHEDLKGLGMVLEAAFSGRQQQVHDAIGSFTPDEPVPAEGAASEPHGTADKDVLGIRGEAGGSRTRKGDYPDDGPVCGKRDNRGASNQRASILDRISW